MIRKEAAFYIDKSNEYVYFSVGKIVEGIKNSKFYKMPNPIIIYSVGDNGKTHLINILRKRVEEAGKHVKVIKAKEIVSELGDKFRESDLDYIFYDDFKKYDMLVVEDMQYLENRFILQKFLFDIMENFVKQEKEVIVTLNCHPYELKNIDSRDEGCFESAAILPILPPSYTFKKEIIENWCDERQIKVSKKQIKRIAKKIESSGELFRFLCEMDWYLHNRHVHSSKEKIKKMIKKCEIKKHDGVQDKDRESGKKLKLHPISENSIRFVNYYNYLDLF